VVVSDAAALFFSLFSPSFSFTGFTPCRMRKKEEPDDDEMDLKAQFAGSRSRGRETVFLLLVAGENNFQRKLI